MTQSKKQTANEPNKKEESVALTAVKDLLKLSKEHEDRLAEIEQRIAKGIEARLNGKSVPEIYQKIIDIMSEIDPIKKDREGDHAKYKFRGIDDIYNTAHPLFAKHGVFITSNLLNASREERTSRNGGTLIYSILDVRFTFWAPDGSSVESIMRGEAMDSSDKASNKAQSVALKYAIMQLLLIPTEDDKDPENKNHEIEGAGKATKQTNPNASLGPDGQPKKVVQLKTKRYAAILGRIMSGETDMAEIESYFILPPEVKSELEKAQDLAK